MRPKAFTTLSAAITFGIVSRTLSCPISPKPVTSLIRSQIFAREVTDHSAYSFGLLTFSQSNSGLNEAAIAETEKPAEIAQGGL